MLNTEDNKKRHIQHQRKIFDEYVSIVALVLIAIFVGYLFWHIVQPREDFYNELWGPAYLLVHGSSPYDTSSLNPELPAAWFPMVIGFFFFVGWLPEDLAMYIWFIFNIIELCAILYIVLGDKRSLFDTIALTLMCLLFPSTVNHFNLGQISITVVLCLVIAVHFVNKDKRWAAAFFIAFAFSKPHLALLSGLGLSYYYYRENATKMFSFFGKTGSMAFLLCSPLFILYPTWIPDAIVSMAGNPPWTYPSLFIFFQKYLGSWGYILWGIVAIFVIGLCYFLWKKLHPKNAMYWSMALAPLLTPYIGSWDFVVLFPLLIFTFSSVDWKRKIILIIFYILAWLGMAFLQLQKDSHEFLFWWVPLWFIGGIALVTDWRSEESISDKG